MLSEHARIVFKFCFCSLQKCVVLFAFIYLYQKNLIKLGWDKIIVHCCWIWLYKMIPGQTQKGTVTKYETTPVNVSVYFQLVSIWRRCFSLHVNSLLVSMKGSVCEAFAIILSKELAVTKSDVVDLVAGATSVHPLPLLRRLLSFSASIQGKYNQTYDASVNVIPVKVLEMYHVCSYTCSLLLRTSIQDQSLS